MFQKRKRCSRRKGDKKEKTMSTYKHPERPGKKGKGHGETNTEGDTANECGWLIDAVMGTACVCVCVVGGWTDFGASLISSTSPDTV